MASLPSKFLCSFHLLSKNAAGENVQKSKHIQDESVSNLAVAKLFEEWVYHYDTVIPFQVPDKYYDVVDKGLRED